MLQTWIAARPRHDAFLESPPRELTYGDVAVASTLPDGQVVLRSEPSLARVVDLMTAPHPTRQVVVIDGRLPPGEAARRTEAARSAEARDAATILFTSGTTGVAKAVRLTAENWEAAAEASAAHLDHRPGDVWLAAMPLHHVGGLSILYRTAYVGAVVRWLPRFEAGAFCRELRSGVTIASVVPVMLRRVLEHDDHVYTGLRAVLVGGGPIPSGLLEEARARGIPALPTYGMTETCAQVATLRPGSEVKYAADPLPGVEVRIGAAGRIEVRGRQVSPGYADADDRPPGEWFTTPDLGELDDGGAVRVLGRADTVIVTGGENVDPRRVEAVLLSHPAVEQAAVVGVPDPSWGHVVGAVFAGSIDADRLGRWARGHLTPAERPRLLHQVDKVPVGELGKADRAAALRLLISHGRTRP